MALRELLVSIGFVVEDKRLETLDRKVSQIAKDLHKMQKAGQTSFDNVTKSSTKTAREIVTTNNTVSNLSSGFERVSKSVSAFRSTVQTAFSSVTKDIDQMAASLDKVSQKTQKVGKKLTSNITKPVIGAATASAGLVSTLGFGRLVGMDNAQAKLRGLGFEGEEVADIMKNVENAVRGTTHTMAEGVSAAAGALAAGVKQGEELERYLKLIGDAATGSGRAFDDMAMIFNRIQASGKLMTNELDMIEHGLPGFSLAMAKHLGVSAQEFRKLVSDGKVTTDQFLDVMEDFAGGMSKAMAETFTGMAKNIKSNIGIIGQNLLEGLFEDSKKGMADFLELLRSDELRTWAKETGQLIRETAHDIVDYIRQLKSYWDSLSPSVQDNIKRVAIFGGISLTVLGPLLSITSFFISSLATIFKGVGAIFKTIGFLLKTVGFLFSGLWKILGVGWNSIIFVVKGLNLLRVAFITKLIPAVLAGIKAFAAFTITLLANPFTWIVLGITAVMVGLILLAKNWDRVSQWLSEKTQWLKEVVTSAFSAIGEWISNVFTNIVTWIQTKWNEALEWTTTTLSNIWNAVVESFMGIVDSIAEWMGNAYDTVVGLWDAVMEFFYSIPEKMISVGKDIIQGLIDGITSKVGDIVGAISNVASTIYDTVTGFFRTASPSRLMIDTGLDIGEGLQIGLDKSALMVARTAQDLARNANPSAQYTPEQDGVGMTSRGAVVYHFSPQTTIQVTGNMTREQEREIETNWKRTIKKWHDEFHREIAIREV